MSELNQVTAYVDRAFRLYGADRLGFFEDFADDFAMNATKVPLFPSGEMDEKTLGRISVHLGLTKKEILSRDETAARRYWNKYPFFRLYREYHEKWDWYSKCKEEMPSPEERLRRALFSDRDTVFEERYDYGSVKARLVEKLKEIDTVMPGTFHVGAEITCLSIGTEVFFSFPKCGDMLRSYIQMVDRAGELFFKALKSELPEEEICELDFLASRLEAKDSLAGMLATYDNVRLLREVYIEENLPGFLSYVRLWGFESTSPWRCKEFFDDINLAQRFVNIFPRAKAKMREFAVNVRKFACTFVWSDAGPVMYPPEEEALDFELFGRYEELYVPIEKRAKETTLIYVDKTADEMFDWEEAAQRLSRAASPALLGGLELPAKEMTFTLPGPETLPRMERRFAAKRGGNK